MVGHSEVIRPAQSGRAVGLPETRAEVPKRGHNQDRFPSPSSEILRFAQNSRRPSVVRGQLSVANDDEQ